MQTQLHPFEQAGLGRAPFRCVGVYEKVWRASPDAPLQAYGSCNYCGTCIRWCFEIKSSDDKKFEVGCDCVGRTGGESLVEGFREVRLEQARKRRAVAVEARRAQREAAWAVERETRRKEREEARQIRASEWQAANAELMKDIETFSGRNDFLADMASAIRQYGSLTDRQTEPAKRCVAAIKRMDLERATSKHIGEEGQRIKNMKLKVTSCRHINTNPIYGNRFLVKLVTECGAVLIWWTGVALRPSDEFVPASFTVKGHDSYQGVAQTTVQRVSLK